MKNWLIEKLGGVSKKDYEEVIQTANSLKNMADDYSQRISDGLKEKAEMEEAGKEMSERISELIDKLNEERKVSNGLKSQNCPVRAGGRKSLQTRTKNESSRANLVRQA